MYIHRKKRQNLENNAQTVQFTWNRDTILTHHQLIHKSSTMWQCHKGACVVHVVGAVIMHLLCCEYMCGMGDHMYNFSVKCQEFSSGDDAV